MAGYFAQLIQNRIDLKNSVTNVTNVTSGNNHRNINCLPVTLNADYNKEHSVISVTRNMRNIPDGYTNYTIKAAYASRCNHEPYDL